MNELPTAADYEAAGLYDPDAPGAPARLELLEWLVARGFTVDDLVAAHQVETLGAIAADRMLVPAALLTRDEAAQRVGLRPDQVEELATAFGYVPIGGSPPGEVGYTDDDAASFATLVQLETIFTHEEALALIRVFGASLGRMAEAAVSLFLTDIESRHIAEQGSELELAQKGVEATGFLQHLMDSLGPVMGRLVMQTIERTRRATIDFEERFVYRYAIGFVDLVGFTSQSGHMSGPELARFLRDFEARAFDTVTAAGARVVKLIGDEVMFAATDPAAAVRAASDLMVAFGEPGRVVVPSGGVAFGDVLVRGGDYHGSVVNLASRLTDEAVPREVLVDRSLYEAMDGEGFTAAGRRMVRGFAEPVEVFSLDP